MIDLPDWQLISIIISIIGSAVGVTAWITWKLSKVTTEVDSLKDNVEKIEDELKYMFRLDLEESHKAVERLRSKLYGSSRKEAKKEDDEE